MTARKVHFDIEATGEQAYCGAVPRVGAPELEMSERRKDVDCLKCLKMMAEYGQEEANAIRSYRLPDAEVEAEYEAIKATIIPNTPGFVDFVEDLAGRYGLETQAVANGFTAGWLKR